MQWYESLGAAITGAAAIGATIFGLITWRKTAHDKLQGAIIADYETRNAQLEADKQRLTEELAEKQKRIEALEAEKRLPLERMTRLVVKQHKDQINSNRSLTRTMGTIAENLTKVVERLPSQGDA